MKFLAFWKRSDEDKKALAEAKRGLSEAEALVDEAKKVNERHRWVKDKNHLGPSVAEALRPSPPSKPRGGAAG